MKGNILRILVRQKKRHFIVSMISVHWAGSITLRRGPGLDRLRFLQVQLRVFLRTDLPRGQGLNKTSRP